MRFRRRRERPQTRLVRFCEIQVPVGLSDEQWLRLVDAINDTAQRGLIDSPFWAEMRMHVGYKTVEVKRA